MSSDISPTPWRYDEGMSCIYDANGSIVVHETTDCVIRGICNGPLLAAAPDATLALRELVARVDELLAADEFRGQFGEHFERELTGARSALAKAGEPNNGPR